MAIRYRIVLVEPEHEINLGAIARLMRNFWQGRLYIVNPQCEIGFTAKMHAKHAADVLANAAICKNLGQAVRGCSLVVGTTGVLRRHRKLLRTPITPRELAGRLAKSKTNGEIAILFGREGIGLNAHEIEMCDLLITIPTSPKYPVMNLSHAVAVALYALVSEGKEAPRICAEAAWGEMRALAKTWEEYVDCRGKQIRNPAKTKLAFKTVVGRAVPTETELRCIIGVMKATMRELKELKGKK